MLKRKHWVITRFNYGLYKKRTGEAADEWMQKRMPIFEYYTVASMLNQTVKDFEWLILVDSATSRKHVITIRHLVQDLRARVELIDGEKFIGKRYGEHTSIGGELSAMIRKIIVPQSRWSIQTRLDNDDAYAPNTIALLQEHLCERRERSVVEFEKGFIYDKRTDSAYLARHKNGSPWVTILVDNDTQETVYDGVHQKYRDSVLLPNYRSWMMVVHGDNVSNDLIESMQPRPVAVWKAFEEMGL